MKKQAEVRLPVGLLDKLADHSEYLADAILLHLPNPETARLAQGLRRKTQLYCDVVAVAAWRLERLLNPECLHFGVLPTLAHQQPTDAVNSLEIGGALWQLRLALDSLLTLTDWQHISALKERPGVGEVGRPFPNLPATAPAQLANWFRTIARQLRAPHRIPEMLLHSDGSNAHAEAVRHGVARAEPSVPLSRSRWAAIMDCAPRTAGKWLERSGAIVQVTRFTIVADLSRLQPAWRKVYDEHIQTEQNGRNEQTRS